MIFTCSDLAVSPNIMQHIVRIESSGNPYAIGVVGGRLQRQPQNMSEAIATAKMLEKKGYNFSLGITQVNRYNLKKYGLHSYEHAFQVCPNLKAGSYILKECYSRSRNWGKAFSCYYSGNFVTGYKHGYVQKIFASIEQAAYSSTPPKDKFALKGSSTVAILHKYDLLKRGFSRDLKRSLENSTLKLIKGRQEIPSQKGMSTYTKENIDNTFVF